MAPTRALGPWMKLYADVVERKAYYSDAQFRGLIRVFALATRARGSLPARRSLAALCGPRVVDFLFAEGDLEEDEGGVVIHNWATYQSRIDSTAAERQRRHRSESSTNQADVTDMSRRDAPTVTGDHVVTPTSTSTSTSTSQNGGVQRGEDEGPALAWLARHGAALNPNGNGLHVKVCRLVAVHGTDRVLATFEGLAATGITEARQYVLGADDRLNPLPKTRRGGQQSRDLLPSPKEAEDAFEHYK